MVIAIVVTYWPYILGFLCIGIVFAILMVLLGKGDRPVPIKSAATKRPDSKPDLDAMLHRQHLKMVAEQERFEREKVDTALAEHYADFPEHLDKLPYRTKDEIDNYLDNVFQPFCEKWKSYAGQNYDYQETREGEFLSIFLQALPTHDVENLSDKELHVAIQSLKH